MPKNFFLIVRNMILGFGPPGMSPEARVFQRDRLRQEGELLAQRDLERLDDLLHVVDGGAMD